MPTKKEELETKLGKIAQIFMFAKDTYLYTDYFHQPDTPEELEVSTNSPHAGHLSFIRHILYRTLIVELAKLFSDKSGDKYRLGALIQSFKITSYFGDMGISETTIQKWESQFNADQAIIDDVITLRDRIYAHTDSLKDDYLNIDLSVKKTHTLLSIAETMIKEIYRVVLNTDLYTESPQFDRQRFGILKLLAKAEKQRQQEIISYYRSGTKDDHTF
jgi:hypothetical protein